MNDISKVEYLQDDDGRPYVRIIDGEYAGVCFMLGAISFTENGEDATMHYEYEITDSRETIGSIEDFEAALGDFVVEQIEKRLEKNDLIYAGGE